MKGVPFRQTLVTGHDQRPSGPPIFVVGAPRSGTTLVARILNRHPGIFMPAETNFFLDIYERKAELGELPDPSTAQRVCTRLRTIYRRYSEPFTDQRRVDVIFSDAELCERIRESMSSYRNALDTFMRVQAEFEGKRRWGNNTPKDLFYVKQIVEYFPDVRFIACTRDVRDFLKSYRDKWRATTKHEVSRIKRLYHPVVTTLLWKASMRRVLEMQDNLPPGQVLQVRYETLVSEPRKEVRRICEYLEESYDPGLLNIDFTNSADQSGAVGIYPDSVGRWREKLSREEAWIAQELASEEMRLFHYRPERIRVNPIRVAGLLLSTPWALWHGLKANRTHTGPVVPYLFRRLEALFHH